MRNFGCFMNSISLLVIFVWEWGLFGLLGFFIRFSFYVMAFVLFSLGFINWLVLLASSECLMLKIVISQRMSLLMKPIHVQLNY